MITIKEIYWAAGFLEGEGCFNSHHGTLQITAGQVQKEPLDRLEKMFKGHLYLGKKPKNDKANRCWVWDIHAKKAASVSMTLYSLMSPKRREQIRIAIKSWKRPGRYIWNPNFCPKGHKKTKHNWVLKRKGEHKCLPCERERNRLNNPKRRRSLTPPSDRQLTLFK